MKFKLDTTIPDFPSKINHSDGIILIGSCFSDEMKSHFDNAGFNTLSNPFGTLFHPLSLADVISKSINDSHDVDVYQRDDLFFSWDSSGALYATSERDLTSSIIKQREELKKHLSKAKLLIVTFGTTWGYMHVTQNKIVGNCHKAPTATFNKQLSDSTEMLLVWNKLILELKKLNPELEIVFTVSPVRHRKDGLIENNRSKARCIELSHSLLDRKVNYFPSYEILIDELRDYRFYDSDLVHPNKDAVNYVWDSLKSYLFNANTLSLIEKVNKVKSTLNHKSLYPESITDMNRKDQSNEEKAALKVKHPEIYWE